MVCRLWFRPRAQPDRNRRISVSVVRLSPFRARTIGACLFEIQLLNYQYRHPSKATGYRAYNRDWIWSRPSAEYQPSERDLSAIRCLIDYKRNSDPVRCIFLLGGC